MKYIMFFGSIGVGKTTLGKYIMEHLPSIDFKEEYLEDNVFLKKFYKDMKKYSFRSTMEMLLLMYRNYQSIDPAKSFTILDNGVEELICYNKYLLEENLLSLDEFKIYFQYYEMTLKYLPKTDLYVYFKCSLNEQIERIKKRNREYEKNINNEFLSKLNRQYDIFLSTIPVDKLWIVDTSKGFSFEKFKEEFINKIKEI